MQLHIFGLYIPNFDNNIVHPKSCPLLFLGPADTSRTAIILHLYKYGILQCTLLYWNMIIDSIFFYSISCHTLLYYIKLCFCDTVSIVVYHVICCYIKSDHVCKMITYYHIILITSIMFIAMILYELFTGITT